MPVARLGARGSSIQGPSWEFLVSLQVSAGHREGSNGAVVAHRVSMSSLGTVVGTGRADTGHPTGGGVLRVLAERSGLRDCRRAAPGKLAEFASVSWLVCLSATPGRAGGRRPTTRWCSIRRAGSSGRKGGPLCPGGWALYPSSVLMCASPARVAGVADLALCVPPDRDGRVAPVVLAAARVAGIAEVHPIGGAQAIAAMTFGTESVRRVDVVVGPGNQYVAEAKRQVAGSVGVAAAFAGPSEVVVVADGRSPAAWAAIDLVVQAEHGPDGLAFLVTWVEGLSEQVSREVDQMVQASPRRSELSSTIGTGGFAVLVDGPEQAIAVANTIAPEHLELQVADARGLAEKVRSAGVVFVGPWAPASVGDYVAGTNHVLPTARARRDSPKRCVSTTSGRVSVSSRSKERVL